MSTVKKEVLVVDKQSDEDTVYLTNDAITLHKISDSGIIYAIPDAVDIELSVTQV